MLRPGRRGPGMALAIACLLVPACDSITTLIPGLSPYRAPAGGKTTLLTFETSSMPFDVPTRKEPSGFAVGSWAVVDGKLCQTVGATDNLANHLRYVGDAFNTRDGRAGAAYSVSVDCGVAREADSPAVHGYPNGIMAMMPYYRDPTHYVLLVGAHQNLSCWVVNGYRPAGAEWPAEAQVWDQWLDAPLEASSSIRWGAEVDCDAHTLKISVNDQPRVTRTIPMIAGDPHWIALAANGNYATFDNLKIVWTR